MEAATLNKKKAFSKGKVKKTIKNVLCRPDPLHWPNITLEEGKRLDIVLEKYKVEIPAFTKPHWKEIKSLPKDQRPKQPKIKKVEGLIFGLTQCKTAIENKECCAVILESSLNPRLIAQPLIEVCLNNNITLLCLDGLRKLTQSYFGIPTSCLGVKDSLQDLRNVITDVAKSLKPPVNTKCDIEQVSITKHIEMNENIKPETETVPLTCPYLYRTNKKTRAFNPSLVEMKSNKEFIGQDFIEFPNAKDVSRSTYMSMIMKRITNNQNRVKRKKADS